MKIEIKVDVTPEEARRFFGLPDVKPLQDELLERFREQVRSAEGLDPARLMAPFVTPNLGAFETMQKAFWEAFSGHGSQGPDKKAP